MMHTVPREGEVRAANEIFIQLPEGHDMAVIIDALAGRNGVSDKACSELSNRIRKLRIKGFRDANRAPHDRLVETILDTITQGDHRLAAAILATWMQTHSALRERAAAHLRGRGIDVVDAPPVRFTSCWDTDEWLLERNRLLHDSDGAYAHREPAPGGPTRRASARNRSRSTANGTRLWPTGRPGTSAPTSAREPAATRDTPSGSDSCMTRKTTA